MVNSDEIIDKYLSKTIIDSNHNILCYFDLVSFFKKELKSNLSLNTLLDKIELESYFSNLKLFDDFKIQFIINKNRLENLYLYFKKFIQDYKTMKDTILFFENYHPNRFLVEIEIKNDNSMNFFDLNRKIKLFSFNQIEDIDFIKLENIALDKIEISSLEIIKHFKNKYINYLSENLKSYGYYQKHFFLSNTPLNKDFNISDKLSFFYKDFLELPWNEIDNNFINKIGEQLVKYFPNHFYYSLGTSFCSLNQETLINYNIDLKKELFKELEKITLKDILDELPNLKKLYNTKYIIENNLIDLYDTNSKLYNKMIKYKEFCLEERKTPNKQREFHRKVLNSFDNKEDILKLNILSFVERFELSYEKKLSFKINDNIEKYDYTIEELILNYNYKNKKSLFLYQGSEFLSVFNEFGGYWLIFFDLIRIERGISKGFDFYETFLNKDKQQSLVYKKRFTYTLFIILQFMNKSYNIENLKNYILIKYNNSSKEDLEDLNTFCQLFLFHEPYVSSIEELFLDYHI